MEMVKQKEQAFLLECLEDRQNFMEIEAIVKSVEYLTEEECYWYLKKWAELGFYIGGTSLDDGIFISKKTAEAYIKNNFSTDFINRFSKINWHQMKIIDDWL